MRPGAGGEQVERELPLPLRRVADVLIDPDGRRAHVLGRQQPVPAAQLHQVVGEADEARVGGLDHVELGRLLVVPPVVEHELDDVVEHRAPDGGAHLPLGDPVQAIVGRPGVEPVAVLRLSHRIGPEEAARHPPLAVEVADGVQLVGAVAAVLLALAAHAVDAGLLGAVEQGVVRGGEHLLQLGIRAAVVGFDRPVEDTAAHAHPAEAHRPAGLAHVQLQEAQRLEVERLEAVLALGAGEARPTEVVGVEPGAVAGVVALLRHQVDHRARRRLDREVRQADDLLAELEDRIGAVAAAAGGRHAASVSARRRRVRLDLERARHPELEPVARVAPPAHAAGMGEADGETSLSRTSGISRARSSLVVTDASASLRYS